MVAPCCKNTSVSPRWLVGNDGLPLPCAEGLPLDTIPNDKLGRPKLSEASGHPRKHTSNSCAWSFLRPVSRGAQPEGEHLSPEALLILVAIQCSFPPFCPQSMQVARREMCAEIKTLGLRFSHIATQQRSLPDKMFQFYIV